MLAAAPSPEQGRRLSQTRIETLLRAEQPLAASACQSAKLTGRSSTWCPAAAASDDKSPIVAFLAAVEALEARFK